MNLTEKSAYIKGLADGLDLDKTTKEGKILAALLELVDEMTQKIASVENDIEEIDEDLDYLNDYVEELDDDLQAVEDFLDEEVELDEDDEDYYEIVCPSCGETVCFDGELDPENLLCPACGEKFGCIVDEDDYKKLSEEQ